MAAENIDNTVTGTGLFNAKIPGLSDAADIQAALRLYHYGSYSYDGANTNTANLLNPSIAKHLQNLVDADAAEVTNRNAAITAHNSDTTDVHGIPNTVNLATKSYVDTSITNAVSGATGGYPNLAGEAIDWNSVDLRFDVEPRIANAGTIITKTESFILSPDDVGKTAILYSSNPMTVTLPANASVEIPVGYSIDIIQTGTGSVTVSEESGAVSINSKSNIKSLDGQYSKGTLVKIADNTWFFFGNLLNAVTPVTPTAPTPTPVAPTPVAPTPVAPTPVAPTPVAPTPVEPAPTPTPPSPTPPSPTPPSPTPPSPTPPAPTPTPPQLPTPSLSVTSQGWNTYPNAAYANITVGNYSYDNTYTSTIGTQNQEFPEEWNLGNLNPNQSYTVYITASRAGYTSAQGSVTFSADPMTTPTPTPPSPTPPSPTPPTPTPTCPSSNIYGVTQGGVYSGSCPDGSCPGCSNYQDNWYKCSDGSSGVKFYTGLGCTTPTPTPPATTCTMPPVVGDTESVASNKITTAGIAYEFTESYGNSQGATQQNDGTVAAQDPAPYTTHPCGYQTNATLYIYRYTAPTPTPPAPTPTPPTTGYYAWGCCNDDPLVIDGPNNATARAEYQSVGGCTAAGVLSTYAAALAAAQSACGSTPTPPAPTPTPSYPALLPGLRYCTNGDVPNPASPCTQQNVINGDCKDGTASGPLCSTPTPTPPAPVAPTPVASCPPNDGGSYQATNVFSANCQDLGLEFVCRSGNIEYCRSAAPAPVAPTPPAPTGPNCQQCDNFSPYADGTYGTRPALECSSGSEYYRICITPSGCLNRTDTFGCVPSTPTAPAPTAPVTPTAPNCNYCDPEYSGGPCGQYGNGTLCYTPSGCENRCDGDYAPTPVAPVAPTPPVSTKRTCSPSDYANQCCSCMSVGACDANGSQSICS